MKFSFVSLSFVLLFFVMACTPKPSAEEETASVDLASEQMLEARFMSEQKTFDYRFEYDGDALQMLDGMGPAFSVSGGALISGRTVELAEIVELTDLAGAPVWVGDYRVYRYMDSQGACSLNEAIVPYGEEAVWLTLTVCEGQNGEQGRMALDQLLEGLTIQLQ